MENDPLDEIAERLGTRAAPAAEPPKQPGDPLDEISARLNAHQLAGKNRGIVETLQNIPRFSGHGFLVGGIAETLGMPVDAMNGASEFVKAFPNLSSGLAQTGAAFGIGPAIEGAADLKQKIKPGEEPIHRGSTEGWKELMSATGLPITKPKDEGNTDTSAELGYLFGEFAGAASPFSALRKGAKAAMAGSKYVPEIVESLESAKGTAKLLKDIGIAGIAPASGAVLGEHAFGALDPSWEEFGKTTGALAGNLRLHLFETLGAKAKSFRSWAHDFMGFGTGARTVAGAQLAGTAQDLNEARQALATTAELSPGVGVPLVRPDGRVLPSNLPVGIESGDEGVMALTLMNKRRDAMLAGDMIAAEKSVEQAMIEDTKLHRGNFKDTESWLQAKQEALKNAADDRLRSAVNEAEHAIENAFRGVEVLPVEAQAAKATQARIMRGEILHAQDDMRMVVDRKWEAVDKSVLVNADPAIERFRVLRDEHIERFGKNEKSWPEEQFRKLFDADGDPRSTVKLQDIIDLDSSLQKEIRTIQDPIQGSRDLDRIGYLKRMSETLNEVKYSTSMVNQTPEQVAALKDAVNATKTFHETFSRGPVAKVLGFDRAGGVDVPDGETIKQFLSQGPGGINDFNAFMHALAARTGGKHPLNPDADMRDLMEKYLRQDFYDKVMPNGSANFNHANAQKWMSNNAGPMQHPMFDNLRKEFDAAIESQGTAAQMREFEKKTTAQLRTNAAALFLEKPGAMFNYALDAPDKYKATKELIEMTKLDKTGKATEGLVQMTLDRMLEQARVGTQINGVKVAEFAYANEGMIRALDEVVPGVAQRFARIAETGKYLEKFRAQPEIPTEEKTGLSGGLLKQYMARIMGARAFSSFFGQGGGEGTGLQTAAMGSQAFKLLAEAATPDQAKKLVRDAMFDKQLFNDLTKDWTKASPQQQAQAFQRLKLYLVTAGIPLAQPFTNPEEANKRREEMRRAAPSYAMPSRRDVPDLGVQ